MSKKLTVSEYTLAIEALYLYLEKHPQEWWTLDVIVKLQLQRREAVNVTELKSV